MKATLMEDWAELLEADPTRVRQFHAAMAKSHLDRARRHEARILRDVPDTKDVAAIKAHAAYPDYTREYMWAVRHARMSKAAENAINHPMNERLELILAAATKTLAGGLLTTTEREETARA